MGVTDDDTTAEEEEEADWMKEGYHVTSIEDMTTANVGEPINDDAEEVQVDDITENVIRTGKVTKESKNTEN